MKSRPGIWPQITCGYQNYGEKQVFKVRSMFDQYYFALPLLHNILNHFLAWMFYHLTSLNILEGYRKRIKNYDNDKYLSISTWGASGETCGATVKKILEKRKGRNGEL